MITRIVMLKVSLMIGGGVTSQAQTNYQFTPSSSTRVLKPLDLGGGSTLHVAERKFGWDSTYVSLLFTASDHSLIDATSIRGNSPITFLFDADAVGTGYMFCGSQTSAGLTYAFITHIIATGAVDWSRSVDNIGGVGFFQDQIATIVPSGTFFRAYTKRGGILANGSFTFTVNATGISSIGGSLMAPAGVLYNIYGGIESFTDENTLYGSGAFASSDYDRSLMMMRTMLGVGVWMKFYDMLPSASGQTEEPFALVPTSDGNILMAGYLTTGATTFEGCLLKLAPDGSVLWCRRYADTSGGLTINAVVELPGGNLLAAGTDAYYQIMLLDLASDGSLIGARRYQAPTIAADFVQSFFTNSAGDMKLIAADKEIAFNSMGESCDFVPVSSVTSVVDTPMVTTHVMTNSGFTPITSVLPSHDRPNDLSWTPTCVFDAVGEDQDANALVAYPVPTERLLQLSGVGSNERVILRTSTGALLYEGRYGHGVDVERLAPGIYFCEVPEAHTRVKLVKE